MSEWLVPAALVVSAFVIGRAILASVDRLLGQSSNASWQERQLVAAVSAAFVTRLMADPTLNAKLDSLREAEAKAHDRLLGLSLRSLDQQGLSEECQAAEDALQRVRSLITEFDVFVRKQQAELVGVAWEIYDQVKHTQDQRAKESGFSV